MAKARISPRSGSRRTESLGRSAITGTLIKKPVAMTLPGRSKISRRIREAVEKVVHGASV